MKKYIQQNTLFSDLSIKLLLSDLVELQTDKFQQQREFNSFTEIYIPKKKIQPEDDFKLVEKSSKIKKNKKNKKKSIVKEQMENIQNIIHRLLEASVLQIVQEKKFNMNKFDNTSKTFTNLVVYLQEKYKAFENELMYQLKTKGQKVNFGHFYDFEENPLPREFLAIVYSTFPNFKTYLESFNRSTLRQQDKKTLNKIDGDITHILMQFHDLETENEFYFEKDIEEQIIQSNTQSNGKIKKKKKNKKKKNKQSNKQKSMMQKNEDQYNIIECPIQQEKDSEYLDELQNELSADQNFEQILTLLQNFELNQSERIQCNVNPQWIQNYEDEQNI